MRAPLNYSLEYGKKFDASCVVELSMGAIAKIKFDPQDPNHRINLLGSNLIFLDQIFDLILRIKFK